MARIIVAGTSGSGKTTFAKELFNLLRILYMELDALFWSEGWQKVPREVFKASISLETNLSLGLRM